MTRQIPNLFTLLNLVFGCLAIVLILQNGITIQYVPAEIQLTDIVGKIWMQPLSFADGNQLVFLSENMFLASFFIFAAALVDFLDGFVARLFKASSEIGKQLDSLADIVSFGVAPSLIMYQLLRFGFMKEEGGLDISIVWLLPSLLIACAGAYRLARFNIDTTQSYGFKGVPIPAAGILIASFPLMLHTENAAINLTEILTNKWVLYSVILVVSWLMISTLPLLSLKFKDYSLKNNIPKLILLAVAVIAGFIFHWIAVPAVFIVYIILSLLFKQQTS